MVANPPCGGGGAEKSKQPKQQGGYPHVPLDPPSAVVVDKPNKNERHCDNADIQPTKPQECERER